MVGDNNSRFTTFSANLKYDIENQFSTFCYCVRISANFKFGYENEHQNRYVIFYGMKWPRRSNLRPPRPTKLRSSNFQFMWQIKNFYDFWHQKFTKTFLYIFRKKKSPKTTRLVKKKMRGKSSSRNPILPHHCVRISDNLKYELHLTLRSIKGWNTNIVVILLCSFVFVFSLSSYFSLTHTLGGFDFELNNTTI